MAEKSAHSPKRARVSRREPSHPSSVPTINPEDAADATPDQPFAEGAQDTIDGDLRHRMISETAYHRYAARGFSDGYDVDDWVQAEAEVDHLLINRVAGAGWK